MLVTFNDGTKKEILLEDIAEVARHACLVCTMPYSNIYADVSLGGVGSEDGYTTVILRTKKGQQLFEEAVEEGYIEIHPKWTDKKKEEILQKIIMWTNKKKSRNI